MPTIFFNAHHAPIGAFATFTLGCTGAKGGLGLELGKPADENVLIGVETRAGGKYQALPFYASSEDESKRYTAEGGTAESRPLLTSFPARKISRDFRLSSDTWQAEDLTFRLVSPVLPIPEPSRATPAALQLALCPAILAELTIDNRAGKKPRTAFFGWQGSDPYSAMRRIDDAKLGVRGVGQGTRTAILCRERDVEFGTHFTLERLLTVANSESLTFGLGAVAAILIRVPAGEQRTVQFAVCFFRGGNVTSGLETTYAYTRYFRNIEAVGAFALKAAPRLLSTAKQADAVLEESGLSPARKFQVVHAVRSYYGSTQLLEHEGRPLWVVNEGEYRMMNTFDLTVDHLFYELSRNPWTVRNVLDGYVARYQYRDEVRFPGEAKLHPGGISFTHDMGVANVFSRPGHSAYEIYGLKDCFSQMTHEQLTNWVLCACTYIEHTRDWKWAKSRLGVLQECLESMLNRDHPDASLRDGVMSLDSSRCLLEGAEITTYDSLDVSLGQSRGNLYLAVKCWAAYRGLEKLFIRFKKSDLAKSAGEQAERCARTVEGAADADGLLPAIVGENVPARIIPAIEGLAFPLFLNDQAALDPQGRFRGLFRALERHLRAVLKPGVCLFPDGGWKLSSTSINSWLSKIYLCQHVARQAFGIGRDKSGEKADAAHAGWLLHPENVYWSWSDQIHAGVAMGSKYYPRGVTSWLWLRENQV